MISSTLAVEAETKKYAKLLSQFTAQSQNLISSLDPTVRISLISSPHTAQNELTFVRLRSKKDEFMISKGETAVIQTGFNDQQKETLS